MAPVFMLNPKRNKAGRFVKSKPKAAAKRSTAKKRATPKAAISTTSHHAKKGATTMAMKRDRHGKFVKAKSKAKTSHRRPAHHAAKHRANPKRTTAPRAKHTTTRKRKYHRRNPKGQLISVMKGALMPAMIFPAAAIVGDVLYGVLPLPASMRSGIMKPVGKLGVAAVLGALGSFVLPARIATLVAGGLIGGVVYDLGRSYLQSTFPALPLAGAYNYPELEFESIAGMGRGDQPSFLGGTPPSFLGDGAFGPMGERVTDTISAYVDA